MLRISCILEECLGAGHGCKTSLPPPSQTERLSGSIATKREKSTLRMSSPIETLSYPAAGVMYNYSEFLCKGKFISIPRLVAGQRHSVLPDVSPCRRGARWVRPVPNLPVLLWQPARTPALPGAEPENFIAIFCLPRLYFAKKASIYAPTSSMHCTRAGCHGRVGDYDRFCQSQQKVILL